MKKMFDTLTSNQTVNDDDLTIKTSKNETKEQILSTDTWEMILLFSEKKNTTSS